MFFQRLMGLANEYSLQLQLDDKEPFDFESEYLKRFPGLCTQCGYPICVCPIVPESTVGRMAKELDVQDFDGLFVPSFEVLRRESATISERVLDSLGGYVGLASKFPFDRGEANQELVMFCLRAANQIGNPEIAERLRSAAIKISDSATFAGSREHPQVLAELRGPLTEALRNEDATTKRLSVLGQTRFSNTVGKIVINELTLGDKYVSANTLTQGPASQVFGTEFALQWQEIKADVDLNEVASELSKLKRQIDSLPETAETVEAQNALAYAENEAKNGRGEKVLEILAGLGNWVKDVGIKLGTEVVVELIKKHTG